MSTQPPPRLVALREMASRSVDRTIDLYSTDEFLESFSAMQDQHTTLEHMYKQTKLCLHENSMVRERAATHPPCVPRAAYFY